MAARRSDIAINHPVEQAPRIIQFANAKHGRTEQAVTEQRQSLVAPAPRKLRELLRCA